MARVRSNLRSSTRWGGAGAEYDRGYQYNLPDRKPLRFGPFKRIWPQGERNVPLDTLQDLRDGVIRDGIVYPIWLRQESVVASRTILAADEYGLIPTLFKVEFYKDNAAANVIKAAYTDGTTSGTDASAVVSDGTKLSTAPWQKYIYFANTALAEIRRYSPVDHAFTTVAGSPTAKFIFFLDNNLVAVYKSGNTWLADWSVDSLPEDWAGAGSGSAPIPATIGEIKGVALSGESAILVGSRGGVRMSPTGSASPAFRIERLHAIRGTPYDSVIGVGDIAYYVDSQRRLVYFDGNSVLPVGAGVPFFGESPVFYPSARTGLLFVSNPSDETTYLLNDKELEWVALLGGSYDYFSDSPFTHDAGYVYAYDNDGTGYNLVSLDLEPESYTQPQLATGRMDLGAELWVDYVDVVRTSITNPVPLLRVLRQLNEGLIEISTFDGENLDEQGTQIRYYVNAYAQFIEVQFGVPAFEGPFNSIDPNAAGNYLFNESNPSGYYRADSSPGSNFSASEDALTWIGDSENAAGNLVLVESDPVTENRWLDDTGIEYIEVMLQKENNEPTAIG